MKFSSKITELKGIGEKNALLFEKLNIETLGELVHHFPRDFETFQDTLKVCELPNSGKTAFIGKVIKEPTVLYKNGKSILWFMAGDETGSVRVTYFNMPYLKKTLKTGMEYVFFGNIHQKGSMLVMEQPKIQVKISNVPRDSIFNKIVEETNDAMNQISEMISNNTRVSAPVDNLVFEGETNFEPVPLENAKEEYISIASIKEDAIYIFSVSNSVSRTPSTRGSLRFLPTKIILSQTFAAAFPKALLHSYSLSPSSTKPGVIITLVIPSKVPSTFTASRQPSGFAL